MYGRRPRRHRGTGGLKGGVLRSDPFQIDLRDGGPILRLHRPDCDLFHILSPPQRGPPCPRSMLPAVSSKWEGTPVFPKTEGDAVGLPGCPGRAAQADRVLTNPLVVIQ